VAKKLLKLTTLLSVVLIVFLLTGCPKPEVYYTLNVSNDGSGSGIVTQNPEPEEKGYLKGTTVTLTADPDAGSEFVRWLVGEAEETGNPLEITMDSDKTVTAVFDLIPPEEYALTINTTGDGTVTADPEPVEGKYEEGTEVELTAVPADGWEFVNWLVGEAEETGNPLLVTMDSDKTVTAVFNRIPPEEYTLTVEEVGEGTVTASPTSEEGKYEDGTEVQLIAEPEEDWAFVRWLIGEEESTDNPITVIMDSNKEVVAEFEFVGEPPVINLSLTTDDLMVLMPCEYNLQVRFMVKVDDPDSDLAAAEYSVKHKASGESFMVEIPDDVWGSSWPYSIPDTELKSKIGNPIPGGLYEITVCATDEAGNVSTKTVEFYVKNNVSDSIDIALVEGGQITQEGGLCIVGDGEPSSLTATVTYDSKITVRVYLLESTYVDGLETMINNGGMIYQEQFVTEALTTEELLINLPDLHSKMVVGKTYNLLVLLFTPECGALGCVDCGIEAWELLNCDLEKDLEPGITCLPCECVNPCDPCWPGFYNPGVEISGVLLTNPELFSFVLTIGEDVFTNEDLDFVERDNILEARIAIYEDTLTSVPEDGLVDLHWFVETPTGIELDATCPILIDFEDPVIDITVENCCVNEGITETPFEVTFTDNIGLKTGKIWVDGAEVVLPEGFEEGVPFTLAGTEVTVEGTITTIDGTYTVSAWVEDSFCNTSEDELECGVNTPPKVDFGPACNIFECPPDCDSETIELYWGIYDEEDNFDYFEILYSHGYLEWYDPEAEEGYVTWVLGDIDCETVVATLIAYDECGISESYTVEAWQSPYPMDNVAPEITVDWAGCGEPEDCATNAVIYWSATDNCLDTVYLEVNHGYLISETATLTDEILFMRHYYSTETPEGTALWVFENEEESPFSGVDCDYLVIEAWADDDCGNESEVASLTTTETFDNKDPIALLGVQGFELDTTLTFSEFFASEEQFSVDAFKDEFGLKDAECTNGNCLMIPWVIIEECLDEESVEFTTNYPINPCDTEPMNRPKGEYTYDPFDDRVSLFVHRFEWYGRDVAFGVIPFCLPLIDCDSFEATLTAEDYSDCTDTGEDSIDIWVDNKKPVIELKWTLDEPTSCATEATVTWSISDGSYPCKGCDSESGCPIGTINAIIDGEKEESAWIGFTSDGTPTFDLESNGENPLLLGESEESEFRSGIEFDSESKTVSGWFYYSKDEVDCTEVVIELVANDCCCGVPNTEVATLTTTVDNYPPRVELDLPDLEPIELKACEGVLETKQAFVTLEATITDGCFTEAVVEVSHGTLPNGEKIWTTSDATFSIVWNLFEGDTLLDCVDAIATVTAYDEAECHDPTVVATTFKLDNAPPELVLTMPDPEELCGATVVDIFYEIDDECLTCGDCTSIQVGYVDLSKPMASGIYEGMTRIPITAVCGCEVPLIGSIVWTLPEVDCGETLVATLVAWDTAQNKATLAEKIVDVDNKAPVVDSFAFDGVDELSWVATDNCFDSIAIYVSHGTLPDITLNPQDTFALAQEGYVPEVYSDMGLSFDEDGTTTWDLTGVPDGTTLVATLIAYDDCCNETVVSVVSGFYSVVVVADGENLGDVDGGGTYALGETATLQATPTDSCYEFSYWDDGSATSTANPWMYEVLGDTTVTAYFELLQFQVTINASPIGGGTVTDLSGTYDCNTQLTLAASPAQGYLFSEWLIEETTSSATDGDNPLIGYSVTEDATITAVFEQGT